MTLIDLEKAIRALLPNASVETDNHGQIIIYTNMMMKDSKDYQSELISFQEKE